MCFRLKLLSAHGVTAPTVAYKNRGGPTCVGKIWLSRELPNGNERFVLRASGDDPDGCWRNRSLGNSQAAPNMLHSVAFETVSCHTTRQSVCEVVVLRTWNSVGWSQ